MSALQEKLDRLWRDDCGPELGYIHLTAEDYQELRAALAAAEAQPVPAEPVGEVVIGEEGMTKGWTVIKWRSDLPPIAVGTKLYDHSPQWLSRFHGIGEKP